MNDDDEMIHDVYGLYADYFKDTARAVEATAYQLDMTQEDVIDAIERAENL